MAGPIIRLSNHLKSTAHDGVIKKIKFRDNDYFQEIPDYLNQAFEKIKNNENK
jgi:DNA-binding MltR family transcriptional regulator